MHVITKDNYEEALDAVRDILVTYVNMADDYRGFGHAVDHAVRFDPLHFLDAETDNKAYYVDLDLLRSGAAIVILCTFVDLWLEGQNLRANPISERYQTALNDGRLQRFADIEAVIREAITRDPMPDNDPWFDEAVKPIYRKYVLGYFQSIVASNLDV